MNSLIFPRVLGFLALITQAASAQVIYTPIAVSGLTARGTGGAMFESFGGAALNASGNVAFYATLDGLGVSALNDTGIWGGAPPVGLSARENDRPPGTGSGVEFDTFSDPMLGPGDQIAFRATLRGAVNEETDAGIWSGFPQALQLTARKGAIPPGIGNVSAKFDSFGIPAINASGAVAFDASVTGLTINEFNDTGIWVGTPGSLQLVARERNVPPGIPNTSVEFDSFGSPVISSSGRIAFNATVRGLTISEENDTGIWAGPPNALTLAAREGDHPPGTGTDVMFDSFEQAVVDGGSQIAFGATIRGLGVSDQNDTGIWAGAPGALRLVVQEDDRPPGIRTDGVEFAAFGPAVLSASGQIAFHGTMRGLGINRENREGIWAGSIAAPALLVQGNDPAPDTSDDVEFLSFEDPVFTAAGTVAFYANLKGEVNFTDDSGIWASDAAGALHLVVREGDFLNGGDVERQIKPGGLTLFKNQGGDGLNSNGLVQVLFKATFIDGTNGLFLATIGAPRIQSITTSESGGMQIQFQGVAGVAYSVEFTTDVASGLWELFSGPIRGTPGPIRVTDHVRPDQATRVYRVRASSLR
jgi:hypothetical protein